MNMQPMKLNNIQTGFKRILLTVATVFMLGNGWAQDAKVLKGRIVNAEGEPIAGAVVNVAEASRIALSDKDGFFTLKNVKPADELYVSSVGFCRQRPLPTSKRISRLSWMPTWMNMLIQLRFLSTANPRSL